VEDISLNILIRFMSELKVFQKIDTEIFPK